MIPSRGRDTRRKARTCAEVTAKIPATSLAQTADFDGAATALDSGFVEHSHRRVLHARVATLGAFRDELGCAAVMAAGLDIEVTSDWG